MGISFCRQMSFASGLAMLSCAALAQALPPGARHGDLIFREGTEAISEAVMAMDRGAFSHVGMLIGEPGDWSVLHATPSEVPGRQDGVVLDTLAFFIDAKRSRHFAVYHVEADENARFEAVQAARAWLGRPFRIADPQGTYCTVLIWQSWQQAGVDLDVTFTPLSLPMMPGKYLLPSGLAASPRLRRLEATFREPESRKYR